MSATSDFILGGPTVVAPDVVQVCEVGVGDDQTFVVIELVKGSDPATVDYSAGSDSARAGCSPSQ